MGVHQRLARAEAEAGAVPGAGFPSRVGRLAPVAVANDSLPRLLPRDAFSIWAQSLAEAVAIVMASIIGGTAYSWFANDYLGDTAGFAAIGLLAAALFVGARRLLEAGRGVALEGDIVGLRRAALAWCGVFALMAMVAFLLKSGEGVSRGAVLTFFVAGFLADEASRAATARALAAWYLPRALEGDHILLVGADSDPDLDRLRAEFLRAGADNLSIVTLDADCAADDWAGERRRHLQQVMDCARATGHGQICVAGAAISPARLHEVLTDLQAVPRAVRLIPGTAIERLLHLPQRPLGRLRAIEVQRAPLNRVQRFIKRAIDLAIAVPALMVAAPVMAAIALAIRLDSPGPILFRQQRLGFRGRPFAILKFRSMTVQENGPVVVQATKNDARVTAIGRFLRASSLDELPQLFNVLRGEMSLVGPRPHACAHDERYARLIEHYELRQHVKPGITGWAQVNGRRGETPTVESMRDRVEFDVWYAKHAGVVLDLEILFRTAFEVFRRRNAY